MSATRKYKVQNVQLRAICSSLEALGFKIYQVYEEKPEKPAIHLFSNAFREDTFQKFVDFLGRHNFSCNQSVPQWILRPHNYGDWESFLSLEPERKCSQEGLQEFSSSMESYIKSLTE